MRLTPVIVGTVSSVVLIGAGVLLVWVGVGFARRSGTGRRSSPARVRGPEEVAAKAETAFGPESAVAAASARAGGDPRRDVEGMDALEALATMDALEPVSADAGARGGDPQRDDEVMAAGVRAGEDPRRDDDVLDVMEALLTRGAFAGLMGQTVGAYARRIREDADALDRGGEGAQTGQEAEGAEDTWEAAHRLRRLRGDAQRIGFFAHRLVLLARHLAPKDRESIDVNRCLDEVLNDAAVEGACVVERYANTVPDVWASRVELRLILTMCVDHVLRAFQGMNTAEAKLQVWTMSTPESVTISFIHNGAWLPSEQRANQFVPFYGSRNQVAALQLPAARYLARKYGGTVELDSRPDERGVLSVQLSVNAGRL